ncbi:MAG: hypothetical protein GX631_01340 [Dehalococcoidales bacterium]|nr:hypothetical protein [Dehalococcoidales bacterium]
MVTLFKMFKTVLVWGWSPVIIATIALVGFYYGWEFWMLATFLGVILLAGLIFIIIRESDKELEAIVMRLRQQAGYFSRRFTGTSSLSIFAIIDTLFNLEDPQLWDWARSCDMCARLLDTWFDSFIHRIEGDAGSGRFSVYIRVYLNELWILNNHYYEFAEQFYEIAEKIDLPPATRDHYNRFAAEYNTFVQNFRDTISELRAISATNIEPPSVKMAEMLAGGAPVKSRRDYEYDEY